MWTLLAAHGAFVDSVNQGGVAHNVNRSLENIIAGSMYSFEIFSSFCMQQVLAAHGAFGDSVNQGGVAHNVNRNLGNTCIIAGSMYSFEIFSSSFCMNSAGYRLMLR